MVLRSSPHINVTNTNCISNVSPKSLNAHKAEVCYICNYPTTMILIFLRLDRYPKGTAQGAKSERLGLGSVSVLGGAAAEIGV